MKKLVFGTLIALMLVAAVATPVLADSVGPVTKTATVTVNAYKSVTITDTAPDGLSFSSLNPGTVKQAEAASPSASIIIAAAAENNGDVTVKIKGTDFSDGGSNTFDIENAFWKTSNDKDTATSMTTSDADVTTLAAGASVSIYHWLSIPNGQAAATYTSTFIYTTN